MSAAQTPAERLALSRERLRRALSGAAPTSGEEGGGPGTSSAWWDELRALPGAGIVIEAAQQWWAGHPLRINTLMALSAAQAVVQPLARRHPLALVSGAFLIGGLLAWRRPWGWIKPALFAGLLPQLLIASLKAQSQSSPVPAPHE